MGNKLALTVKIEQKKMNVKEILNIFLKSLNIIASSI